MSKKEIVWHKVEDGDLPNYSLIHYVQDNFGEHCYYDISHKVWRTVNDEIRHIPEYWCETPRLDAKQEMMTPQEHLEESINYALKTVELGKEADFFRLNETEQGIFDWGIDFLEMQKKSLESMNKDFSVTTRYELEHISKQILLLNKFIDLIKKNTILTPWENDPKAK